MRYKDMDRKAPYTWSLILTQWVEEIDEWKEVYFQMDRFGRYTGISKVKTQDLYKYCIKKEK